MTGGMPDWFWLSFALLTAFAVFVCLRVLANYRQHEIDRHDLACEVRRLRAEYEARMRDKNDVEALNEKAVR